MPVKFCVFIDGLDEYTGGEAKYHGSYAELIETLQKLAKSPHFKICVSSRPWTPFEAAFGGSDTQLRLESLTKSDIQRYVQDRFDSNTHFQTLKDRGAPVQALFDEIVARAQGVFLWVYLVGDSLLKGMLHADDISDLQRRLNELPYDLDEYFRRILETIEPVYWDQSVRIFQTSIDADQPLPLLAYEFLDRERTDPKYALTLSPKTYTELTTERTHQQLKDRLNARCKDLLEVVKDPDETIFMKHKVDFLHRTVRDFFRNTTAISDIMRERETIQFDSLLSLSKIMLSLTKSACFHNTNNPPTINRFFSFTDSLMHYCRKIETEYKRQPHYHNKLPPSPRILEMFEVLDELDHVGSTYMSLGSYHWTNNRDTPKGLFQEYQQNTYLGATIQARLSLYVQKQLEEDPAHLRKRGRPLLDYALRPTIVTPIELVDIDIGPVKPIVELLLRKGANPNHQIYIYDKQTPWELFLRTYYDHAGREAKSALEGTLSPTDMYETMRMLLTYGADPDVSVRDGNNNTIGVAEILRAGGFSLAQVDEVNRLISLCRQQRSQRTGWVPWAWSFLGR